MVHGGDAEEHGARAARRRGSPPRRSGRTRQRRHRRSRVPNSPAQRPCTWKSGKHSTRRSSAVQSQAVSSAETPASSERMGVHRPFRLARGAGRVDDQRVVAGLPGRCDDGPPCPAARASSSTPTRTGPPPPNASGRARSHTASTGRASATTWSSSAAGGRRAHRHEDRTAAQHAEQGLNGGERGAGAPQHAVARRDAPLGQGCGPAGVRASRVAASTTRAPSQPSISTGASGRAAHRAAHTSGSVRPGGSGPPVRPVAGRDERPHHRRAQVIV